jgi:hypothetical protein
MFRFASMRASVYRATLRIIAHAVQRIMIFAFADYHSSPVPPSSAMPSVELAVLVSVAKKLVFAARSRYGLQSRRIARERVWRLARNIELACHHAPAKFRKIPTYA